MHEACRIKKRTPRWPRSLSSSDHATALAPTSSKQMVELRTAEDPNHSRVIAAAWFVIDSVRISSAMCRVSAVPTSERACASPISSFTRVSSSKPCLRAKGISATAPPVGSSATAGRPAGESHTANRRRWSARGTSNVFRRPIPRQSGRYAGSRAHGHR